MFLLLTIIMVTTFGSVNNQNLKGGSFIYEHIRELSFSEREEYLKDLFFEGNIPKFFFEYREVVTNQKDANGVKRELRFFVSPTYLSVGVDDDYYITPLSPMLAQQIAHKFNSSLPTPKLVDIIYESSDLKLEPFNYIPRGRRNETEDLMYEHSKVIQAQIKASGGSYDTFVAGVKKDIVISSKLADSTRNRHVTIYGWHRLNAKPIQPVSNVHINTYVDYSHGARFISKELYIDNKLYNYEDVLRDPILSALLNYDSYPLSKVEYDY